MGWEFEQANWTVSLWQYLFGTTRVASYYIAKFNLSLTDKVCKFWNGWNAKRRGELNWLIKNLGNL